MSDGSDTPDFAALFSGFARKEWGNCTALSICLTHADEHGDFEVALVDDLGEPVWQPAQFNVNDPKAELDWVYSVVYDFYRQWQVERYGLVGEWKVKQ